MAYITENQGGHPVIVLDGDRTRLTASDELAFASGGLYRLLPFDTDAAVVNFDLIDGSGEDHIELPIRTLERKYGSDIRMTGDESRRPAQTRSTAHVL